MALALSCQTATHPAFSHQELRACAVGFAEDEGLFALSDKVVAFFPDHLPEIVDANLAALTIEDLLTMRTGHDSEKSGSVSRGIESSRIAELWTWIETTSTLPGWHLHDGYSLTDTAVVAGAGGQDEQTLAMELHFAETAFRDRLTFCFTCDRLTFGRSVNINSVSCVMTTWKVSPFSRLRLPILSLVSPLRQ